MEKQEKIFPDMELKADFKFEVRRDEKNGRVHLRDGGEEWTFVLNDGKVMNTWSPRELSVEKYSRMIRQAAAILKEMQESSNAKDGQIDLDLSK